MRLALSQELADLDARQRLSGQLGAVERFIQDKQTHAVLSRCHAALNPGTVSRKLTALAATYVTEALAAAMNAELKALGYKRRVQPDLTGRTELGVTKVTLRLQTQHFIQFRRNEAKWFAQTSYLKVIRKILLQP